MINGHCDEKFSELRKILDHQLNSNFELGASVAVEWKGKEVVNLYGGYKDENKNSEWQEYTIVNVFSVTKAVSGICISRLIDAGLLDVNKNVGHYWPEYACNGKENTKVIDFLTHRAGMFGFENTSGVGISFGFDRICIILESLDLFPKFTENGTQVLFVNFGKDEANYCLNLLKKLRSEGIKSEIYPSTIKMKKQMQYADRKKVEYVLLVGENEMRTNTITVKNMFDGSQKNLTFEQLLLTIK